MLLSINILKLILEINIWDVYCSHIQNLSTLFFVVGIYYLNILLQTPMKFYKKENTSAQSQPPYSSTELAALLDNCTDEFTSHVELEVNNPVCLVLSANFKVKFECSYKLLIIHFYKSCVLNNFFASITQISSVDIYWLLILE